MLLTVAVGAWGCSLPEVGDGEWDAPQPLLSSESTDWDAIPNLDDFFRRIYKCAASALHEWHTIWICESPWCDAVKLPIEGCHCRCGFCCCPSSGTLSIVRACARSSA